MDMLRMVVRVEHIDRQERGDADQEGRPLLELIAYGVFGCHDSDPAHRANALYVLVMLLALSRPIMKDAVHHTSDIERQNGLCTQDIVRFLRVDKTSRTAAEIQSALVKLLEDLTCNPSQAVERRNLKLLQMLEPSSESSDAWGPPVGALRHLLALPPVDAVHMMREGRGGQIDAVTTQLYALFHACKPITVDTHGKTFFEVWFSLPDPGNLRSLHVKLWKDVWKDYSSDDSIVARRKLA
jgi:hypothetical protein